MTATAVAGTRYGESGYGDHIRFYLREDGTKLDWLKAECSVPEALSIDIRKQAEARQPYLSPRRHGTFETVVTNTGNVDLSNVAVSDALVPNRQHDRRTLQLVIVSLTHATLFSLGWRYQDLP